MKYEVGHKTQSGQRTIQDGSAFNHFFPKPSAKDTIVIQDGEVTDTIELMKKVVWKYLNDTKNIAAHLKGHSLPVTCQNIWEFLFHHIQYKLDQPGLEQLRRPARSWADRTSGIDCDCFSIFASSILTNLQIPHSFRITKYGGTHFQHVYVVVPHAGKTLVIDPVLSRYNYEQPYTQYKDFAMNLSGIDVAVLSGHASPALFGIPTLGEATEVSDEELYNYLITTRDRIAQHPEVLTEVTDPVSFQKMLDYAIAHWYTDQRDEALMVLIEQEHKFSRLEAEVLGDLDGEVGGFFKNVKEANGKQNSNGKKIKNALIRYNPLSAAARLGFLAALRLDIRKIATKLRWAYFSREEAQRSGVSPELWQRSKTALSRVEHLFVERMRGKKSALRNAIVNSRAGNNNQNLGEPATLAASLAAATPIIVATIKILKDAGLLDPSEPISEESIRAEMAAHSGGYPTSSIPANPSTPMMPMGPSTGLMSMVRGNPGLVAAGAGALIIGGYLLFFNKKKPEPRKGLSGPRRTPRSKKTIQKVTLK